MVGIHPTHPTTLSPLSFLDIVWGKSLSMRSFCVCFYAQCTVDNGPRVIWLFVRDATCQDRFDVLFCSCIVAHILTCQSDVEKTSPFSSILLFFKKNPPFTSTEIFAPGPAFWNIRRFSFVYPSYFLSLKKLWLCSSSSSSFYLSESCL